MQHNKMSRFLSRSILKSVLLVVDKREDWQKWISLLARISYVTYSSKQNKQRKGKCCHCSKTFQNFLLLILHLQLVHTNDIQIIKYEFSQQTLAIHAKKSYPNDQFVNKVKKYFVEPKTNEFVLILSQKERSKQIMSTIFSKFTRLQSSLKRQYYHSIDIFREVRPESEGEDSEHEINHVERQLQKMRISEFTDVNESDKTFFIAWNQAVQHIKKIYIYIGTEAMKDLLTKFAITARQSGIKRVSLIMHAWTLWSTGKISSVDVTYFLSVYDNAVMK